MTNVTIQVNDRQKKQVERVAQAYDCSQSGAGRLLFEQAYNDLFGSIHPDALDRHDVDFDALVSGELEPDAIDDDLKMDSDGPAKIPTADGGTMARVQPTSYTPTYTPQDLATSGTELTWDELKDAISRHWSDTLAIHADRVRPSAQVETTADGSYSHDEYALKANQRIVTKILVGMLRSEGDVVTETDIERVIMQYTDHQITRSKQNYKAGKQYKKDTYKPLITDYFVAHPDPLKDEYYTSEAAAEELFRKEVKETIASLVEKTWVLDPKEHAQRETINPKKDASQWVADLAEFRQGLGFLHAITSEETWSKRLEEMDDPVGDLFNAQVAAGKTYNELIRQYVRVNPWARFAAAHAVLEIEDENVLTDEVSTGDDWKEINADNPTQPTTKWVQRQDKPLSPQAQIDTVSEKL